MFITRYSALYVSIDVVDYNMPCVCENASISVNHHNCDDMLHESISVVKISNVKPLKKKDKYFHENLSKFICENDDLIAKFNESNKLVEKYKKLAEHSLKKLKEFECLNVDLDAKLVLSNKLVDDLKCETNLLRCMPSVWLLNLLLKRKKIFVAIMLCCPILCLL